MALQGPKGGAAHSVDLKSMVGLPCGIQHPPALLPALGTPHGDLPSAQSCQNPNVLLL